MPATEQALTGSFSMLPGAETVIYMNAPRIINEALPRLMPQDQYQKFRSSLDQVKAFTGIDLNHLEYMVLEMRFKQPEGDLLYPLPELLFVMRGDFNANTLIGMAMMATQGKLREESYGNHKLNIVNLREMTGSKGEDMIFNIFPELAIAALDDNTLAVGIPSYIKAAFDAVDGRGRVKGETLASALRNPNVLMSASGAPFKAFADAFGLMGGRSSEACDCTTRFGDFYAAIDMDANNFKFAGAMHADNPRTANIMRNLFSMLIGQLKNFAPDEKSQAMVNDLKLVTQGSEVTLDYNIPQEVAAKYIREMLAPPPKEAAETVEPQTTKPKPKHKSGRRKRSRRR